MKKDQPLTVGVDVPLDRLVPIRKRVVSPRGRSKLKANIRSVGIIDPLLTCRDGDKYYILDGYIRFQILAELGVGEAPCLVIGKKDFYTPNRQVNHLSRFEESRMLHKALESLSESEIAEAFGLQSLKRKKAALPRDTHPDVLRAVGEKLITLACAKELTFVVPERQGAILEFMSVSGDYGISVARSQILNTPKSMQVKKRRGKSPWERAMGGQKDLADRLQEVGRHYSFYRELYQTYIQDLLKMVIYVRELLGNPLIKKWLQTNCLKNYELLRAIISDDLAIDTD